MALSRSPPAGPASSNASNGAASVRRDYGTLPTTHEQGAAARQLEAATAGAVEGPKRRLVPGWAYLVLFVILYSANNAVLAGFLARGPPYTICGIMCVGNAIGCLSLYPVFYKQITWKYIRKVTASQWGWMLLGSLLSSVLGSVAYLEGLRLTSVPARAMTGRLESVDFLLASAVFLGDHHGRWVSLNALLTVVGVLAAVFYPLLVQHHDPHGKVGYLYLIAGGWGYTLSLIITKRYLVHIPVGLLSLFKLALGTILFHALSTLQMRAGGMQMGLYSWPLWRAMLWYAPLFVTSTMVLWLRALKLCSPALLSVGMNMNFITTVAFGILLLGKWPTPGELLGGAFILLSVASGIAETVVNGDGDDRKARRAARKGLAVTAGGEKGVGVGADWPVAQAATPVYADEVEKGGVGTEEREEPSTDEDEEEREEEERKPLLTTIHKHKHTNHHVDFETLVEGDGVGLHPFS